VPEDPYSDPVTGVLYNKLGLISAADLETAEREITHAALILLDESPVSPAATCLTCGRSTGGFSVTSMTGRDRSGR
jgi:fido (protein-threonine AMPylation protein)